MKKSAENTEHRFCHGREPSARRDIERTNARLRHFRGVAAGVMNDALRLWNEIWNALQDPRSCEEILDGLEASPGWTNREDRIALLEKLHLLGIRIDYARRLCEGDIGMERAEESEEY